MDVWYFKSMCRPLTFRFVSATVSVFWNIFLVQTNGLFCGQVEDWVQQNSNKMGTKKVRTLFMLTLSHLIFHLRWNKEISLQCKNMWKNTNESLIFSMRGSLTFSFISNTANVSSRIFLVQINYLVCG